MSVVGTPQTTIFYHIIMRQILNSFLITLHIHVLLQRHRSWWPKFWLPTLVLYLTDKTPLYTTQVLGFCITVFCQTITLAKSLSYEVSFMSICENIDPVITAPHCTHVFDLGGDGQADPPQKIRILINFCISGPNLVILAWTGGELSRGQAQGWFRHRHKQMDKRRQWQYLKAKTGLR